MDCVKRNREIDIRFNEDEYQVILELEKTLGMRKTDLVHCRLLQNTVIAVVTAKELIGILNGLGSEMGRCGNNNINQLANIPICYIVECIIIDGYRTV